MTESKQIKWSRSEIFVKLSQIEPDLVYQQGSEEKAAEFVQANLQSHGIRDLTNNEKTMIQMAIYDIFWQFKIKKAHDDAAHRMESNACAGRNWYIHLLS